MRVLYGFFGVLLACSCVAEMRGQAVPTTELARIVVEAHMAGNFDGVVVVSRGGEVVFSSEQGDADRTTHVRNKLETTFRLGSLTKQVTSLLVMREVEAGRMTLDSMAGEVMPGLPAASGQVTIRQLLTHVSGLANPSDGPDGTVPAFYLRKQRDAGDMTKAAKGFCSRAAKREPGGRFEYNNCDYIVLGAILEHVRGMSFAALVGQEVIGPLKLRSWGLFSGGRVDGIARGYQADGSLDAEQNVATYGSAGALYGNALDVAKWDAALMDHRLLSAEATETMFRADPKLYGEALGSWSYDLPGATPGVHLVERQGDIGATRVLNLLIPGMNMSIVIVANTERADLFDTYSKKGLGYALVRCLTGGRDASRDVVN